jgi:hypothetical protein
VDRLDVEDIRRRARVFEVMAEGHMDDGYFDLAWERILLAQAFNAVADMKSPRQ